MMATLFEERDRVQLCSYSICKEPANTHSSCFKCGFVYCENHIRIYEFKELEFRWICSDCIR